MDKNLAALIRPRNRRIFHDATQLSPQIGLFGTCSQSTWRNDLIIPILRRRGLPFFNPQKSSWQPEDALTEAQHMAEDQVIVLPVSKESEGYASLAETGWATLGALLRGQEVNIFIELSDSLPRAAIRSRALVLKLAKSIEQEFPIFYLSEDIQEAAQWGIIKLTEVVKLKGSKITKTSELIFPDKPPLCQTVALLGNSGNWRDQVKLGLDQLGLAYYDPFKVGWTVDDPEELQHKNNDSVIIYGISAESDGYGALAESGWIAINALLRGQSVFFYIEGHSSSLTSVQNRARTLVKAHIERLNKRFPGLIVLVNSLDDAVLQAGRLSQI